MSDSENPFGTIKAWDNRTGIPLNNSFNSRIILIIFSSYLQNAKYPKYKYSSVSSRFSQKDKKDKKEEQSSDLPISTFANKKKQRQYNRCFSLPMNEWELAITLAEFMDDGNTYIHVIGRRLRLRRRTEDFSPSPIVSPTDGCSSCFLFSHFFFFLFFVCLVRPQRRWLTDPCRCLLTCLALLSFPLPLRESADFRQLTRCPPAPPAAMTTIMTITDDDFFVLSSGFGLSSGWHVHPPTCIMWHSC